MRQSKLILRLMVVCALILLGFSMESFGETTKRVEMFQRITQKPLEPTEPSGTMDTGQTVTCILYKESGRCVFDPDVEAIQTYEIYNGTTRVGVYNNQYSFVQDAFNLSGVLILKLTTRNSTLSGKILNY